MADDMTGGTTIYCIHEEGPAGDTVGFVDLSRLDLADPVQAAYRAAVIDAADQRRRRGYGVAMLPHEGMLLLMREVPAAASVSDSAMPFTIHGFASLEAEED